MNEKKILTLTFLAIHGKAPTYICELVEQHTLRRELRSTRSGTAADDRAFVTATPRLWNCLAVDIRSITTISSFKKHLKTGAYESLEFRRNINISNSNSNSKKYQLSAQHANS